MAKWYKPPGDEAMRAASLRLAVMVAAAVPCAGWTQASMHPANLPSVARKSWCSLPKATEGSSALQMVVSRREAAAAGVGLAVLTLLPSEAVADMTLNTFKKSYFRWVPRIEAGRDFFVLELGAQIDNQQWAEVLKAFGKLRNEFMVDLLAQHLHNKMPAHSALTLPNRTLLRCAGGQCARGEWRLPEIYSRRPRAAHADASVGGT